MSKLKILYIEDEQSLGRIVKESLESRDFEVTMLTDGKDVITTFEKLQPDICILDVMLPVKDGFTLAGELRQLNTSVPIIFLTAKTQTDDVVKGFETGGNDYIRKPFSLEELIVRIKNLLQFSTQKHGTVQSPVPLGKFIYSPSHYELKLNDTVRKLSHREASLLSALIEYRNATITRKEIMLRLWGDDSVFNSRNLDVYITKLRDYLKADPAIEIITIKGIGYRFMVG
ncbi:MAG: response regulator transcription factor [Flammeovirgaceae bacterium]|nr:response regulator transcription factor [Flammeovirgaceae bacterium]